MSDIHLDRRALLGAAIVQVSGATSLAGCARRQGGPYFNARQMADLDVITDIIIPETDTPGARAAGVPAFLESMMVQWASDETRTRIAKVLADINARARADHGGALADLAPAQQVEAVRAFDAAAIGDEGGGYRTFKQLVLLGYYTSEIGATQELRYELVPGVWRADIPLAEIGRAWAV